MACLVFLIQEDNFLTKGDIIVMMMFFELFVFLINGTGTHHLLIIGEMALLRYEGVEVLRYEGIEVSRC